MTQMERDTQASGHAAEGALDSFVREVRAATTEAGVFSALVSAAMRALGCERAAVVRRSAEGRLTIESSIGFTPAARSWIQGPERRGVEGLLQDHAQESWELGPDPWGEGSDAPASGPCGVGAYPIEAGGQVLGWLLVGLEHDTRRASSTPAGLAAMLALAGSAASHLRGHRDLESLSRVVLESGGAVFERVRQGEWVYRRVSEGLAALLGHPVAELEAGRVTAVGIKLPEDRERCSFEIERAMASRAMRYTTEYRIVRADGEVVRVRETARVVETDSAGPSRILGVMTPADAAPRRASTAPEAVPTIFQEFPLGVCDVDLTGKLIRGNAALTEMLGLTDASLSTTGIEDMLHPDDLPLHRTLWAEISAGRLRTFKTTVQRWRKADGSFMPLQVCGFGTVYLADARPIIRYVLVDGGEVAALRESLRSTQAKLQSFFEQASVGTAEVALDGRFTLVNPKLGEILGYAPADLIGQEWQRVSHPADIPRCEAKIAEIAAERLGSFTLEKRYLRKDGSVVWGIVTLSSVRDASGRIERFAVFLQDVTDRHMLQDRLSELGSLRRGDSQRVLRVLVVDDEPAVRATVGAMLAHNAFEAETAATLSEARSLFLAGEPFDVVLCDAGLTTQDPQGPDHELAATFPGAKTVLMSGDPKLTGLSGGLRKPFSVDDLTSAVLQAAGVRGAKGP